MSEFPAWVERNVIGWSNISYEQSQEIHRWIQAGRYPDPRQRPPSIWRRMFNRRKAKPESDADWWRRLYGIEK